MTPLISHLNHLATATPTAGSAEVGAPPANLATDRGSDLWQTRPGVVTAAQGAVVDVDAGAAVDWRVFAVARTNLTTAATVRFTLGSAQGLADLHDSGALGGVVAGVNQLVHATAQVVSARWLRIAIDDAANPDGFIAVGFAWGGPAWEMRHGASWASTDGGEHRLDQVVTAGGQVWTRRGWHQRAAGLQFDWTSADERWGAFLAIDRAARAGANLLFIPDPASAHRQAQAVLGQLRDITDVAYSHPNLDCRSWRGRLVERL